MSEIEEEIAEEMGDDAGVPGGVDPETGEIIEAAPEQDAPEQAASAPRSQKEIDELTKKLEAEAQRHAKRVAELMGDDFALLVPSPVDWTPGFLFNVPEMLPSPDAVAALDAILGRAGGVEFLPAEDAEACSKCNALGQVLTGSRAPGQETKLCVTCNGAGWVTKQIPYTPPVLVQNGAVQPNSATVQPNQPIAADRWGRPYGHRDYGLDPSLVNA
jgi:hypothetical protein